VVVVEDGGANLPLSPQPLVCVWQVKGVRRFGLKGVLAGASLGAEAYDTVGDSWVQGGLFMLKGGTVVWGKPEHYPGDFPTAKEWAAAMRAVGAPEALVVNDTLPGLASMFETGGARAN
jgi:hypothetical protein